MEQAVRATGFAFTKTIATLLNRDRQILVSESKVGRILKKLLLLGRIKPVCFYYQRTPELKGCVERCNRTIRYEFYRFYDGITSLLLLH